MRLTSSLHFTFSAPAGYGHELSAENRLERILEVGELLPKILSLGRAFLAKYFPSTPEPLANLARLPDDLDEEPPLLKKGSVPA